MDTVLLSFFNNVLCSNFSYKPGSRQEADMAFRCYVFLVSFNLKQFLSFSLSFLTLILFKSINQYFY